MGYELFGDTSESLKKNAPGVAQGVNMWKHGQAGDLATIGADIADLGVTGLFAYLDPLGALVGAGVGFLIDWVKPLHDMLTWVTGDADKIGEHRDQWQAAQRDLVKLADEMSGTLKADLATWAGPASAAAKQRLDAFIEGTRDTAKEIGNIDAILALSAALMDTAMSLIKDLISQFVEWLIITWLAAQAAAIPTLGASEAAAGAATAGEAAVATSRGARILQKVMAIIRKLQAVLAKVMKALKDMKAKSFWKLTGKGGNTALGPGGFGRGLVGSGREARTALGGRDGHTLPFGNAYDPRAPAAASGIKIAGGIAQGEEDDTSNVPSTEEINQKLNIRADP
ncbi:hypothetical protein HUT06_33745 [Actinomadura sp. NAK00032]|uniref:hypothetical protein n=1 Tax=Actinomadura sp. NAK00032 TaxID=2742128 RepID=UPI001590B316|nr:hypothetical protein [Actinomadura sp. NAK00032]QKW38364.1 hypothetical protein HUT06_33745 [Actinomadura sp. NAK00032]